MRDSLNKKYNKLASVLKSHKKTLVALSGGLDSSFLLYASVNTIGAENSYAAIGVSPSLPHSELDSASKFALKTGLDQSHLFNIETNELDNPDYRKNSPDRCFHCKHELFSKLSDIARKLGTVVVCDGANTSDTSDYRPGTAAAQKLNVSSPLLEAGLSKDDIRQLAREFDLEIWDKPQSACLASRIPYNSEVTEEKLRQIEEAETFLRSMGYRQLRVRHHGDLARIELPVEDMLKVINNGAGEKISKRFREIGFLFTTLNISGFKSGSMNIMLKGGESESTR